MRFFYLGVEDDGYPFGRPIKIYPGIHVDAQYYLMVSNAVPSV